MIGAHAQVEDSKPDPRVTCSVRRSWGVSRLKSKCDGAPTMAAAPDVGACDRALVNERSVFAHWPALLPTTLEALSAPQIRRGSLDFVWRGIRTKRGNPSTNVRSNVLWALRSRKSSRLGDGPAISCCSHRIGCSHGANSRRTRKRYHKRHRNPSTCARTLRQGVHIPRRHLSDHLCLWGADCIVYHAERPGLTMCPPQPVPYRCDIPVAI